MEESMGIIRRRLDNLNIKASVDGELASLNPEIGEVVTYGTRVGTINILDSYKLRVDIDEHYIARIQRGLTGECDFASYPYTGVITKIYPEVQNGRFAVDMVFTEEVPNRSGSVRPPGSGCSWVNPRRAFCSPRADSTRPQADNGSLCWMNRKSLP